MLRRRNDAVAKAIRGGATVSLTADAVESSMRAAVIDGRMLARGAGIARLRAEFKAAGLTLSELPAVAVDEVFRDVLRARSAAQSYAARWFKRAEGNTVRQAAETANASTRGSLKRIGATESSEAFNSGRASAVRRIRTTRRVMRVFDATLDKRTCDLCAGLDGTIVGAREAFPAGEPGSLHPFCRCSASLLISTETAQQVDIEAA